MVTADFMLILSVKSHKHRKYRTDINILFYFHMLVCDYSIVLFLCVFCFICVSVFIL